MTNLLRPAVTLCIGLLFLLVLGACGKAVKLQAVERGASVLAFGDSVTYGTGAGPGEDWPTLLAAKTGWVVHNAGVPGDTAAGAAPRLQAAIDETRPKLIFIEIGGNDFLRRQSASQVKEDVRKLIVTAKASGAQVVLIGVPELSMLAVVMKSPQDSALYAELAKEEQVALLSDVFAAQLRDESLRADPIHPNAQGYRQMANAIYSALQKLKVTP